MGSLSEHKRRIREHLDEINDAIDYGIEKKPITIGFHTSACGIELLELLLHKFNLIPFGKIIKHNWFKRPKPEQKVEPLIDRKLPVIFQSKDKIYDLIYTIEENRDNLLYGKCTKSQIELVLNNFMRLKEIIYKELKEEINEQSEGEIFD